MIEHIDNPPAFPRPQFSPHDVGYEDAGSGNDSQEGMTLRDYFAGQCVIGIVANLTGPTKVETVAATAYDLASAMLTERVNPIPLAERPEAVVEFTTSYPQLVQFDALKKAREQVDRCAGWIEEEMTAKGNNGTLWTNQQCEAWPAYQNALVELNRLREEFKV